MNSTGQFADSGESQTHGMEYGSVDAGDIGRSPTTEPSGLTQHSPAQAPRDHRQVPYGALAQERARRKELQRQLDEFRSRQAPAGMDANGAGQDGAMSAPNDQGPVPGGEMPSGEAEGDNRSETETGANAEALAGNDIGRNYVGSVRDFLQSHPDFKDAYRHATMNRARELVEIGYLPSEAMQVVVQNEMEIVQRALAQGRNPAEVIYNLALGRGYRRLEAENAQPQLPNEAQRVALAARGQAGAKSLSAAGGGANGTVSLETLAQMSDDEFATATKGDRWEKMMR